jgi:hypothetical protein
MKQTAFFWMILSALLLGAATGCAPDGTSSDGTGKSSPSGKSGPAQPKPPKEDPG